MFAGTTLPQNFSFSMTPSWKNKYEGGPEAMPKFLIVMCIFVVYFGQGNFIGQFLFFCYVPSYEIPHIMHEENNVSLPNIVKFSLEILYSSKVGPPGMWCNSELKTFFNLPVTSLIGLYNYWISSGQTVIFLLLIAGS